MGVILGAMGLGMVLGAFTVVIVAVAYVGGRDE